MSRHISPVLPLEMLIARRQVPDVFYISKYGLAEDFDATSTPVDITSAKGIFDGFAPTAQPIDITSTDGTDTAPAGTGIRSVQIYGLDTDGLIATQTYDTAGIGGATTAESWKHIYRVKGRTAGTGLNNNGVVSFTQATSGKVLATIAVGAGQTEQAAIEIPSNKYGVVAARTYSLSRASGAGSKSALVGYWVLSAGSGDTCWRRVNPIHVATDAPPHVAGQYAQLLSVEPGDQIVTRVFTADAANLNSTAEFDVFFFPWPGGPDEAG